MDQNVVLIAPWVVDIISQFVNNKLSGETTIIWCNGGIRSVKVNNTVFPPKHIHADNITLCDQGVE
jgi:hypothetical protein